MNLLDLRGPDFLLLYSVLMVAAIVLVSSIFMEVRHYRQTKALAEIERSSSAGYVNRPHGI